MDSDKIKYSDLIQPDDAIEKLIQQISELSKHYETMLNAIRAGSDRIVHAVKTASSATREGRKEINETTAAADRLERAYKELQFSVSSTGKQVAWLKAQTIDNNKATVEQQRYLKTAITSYDRLKADLKESVALYKSLTEAERENSSMGQQLLQDILGYKNQLAALDAQMRPHIQALTAVQKAEQKLAYLRSDEGKKLLELQAQIRAEIAARKQQKAQLTALEKANLKLQAAQSSENEQIKLYTIQANEANKIAELNARIANSAEGSYNRLAAQYELNKIQLNKMSAEQRSAADTGQKLEKQTAEIYQQMTKLQEATGNYRLSVGNYKTAWNGLGVAVNQVVRELPAAAISLNTFFLGISNNIPMVVDEISRLRAEGKSTASVIKSMIGALFSWNSILVILLTVFSMYGDKIIDGVASMFKFQSATISTTKLVQGLNEELKNGTGEYGKNFTALRRLTGQYRKLTSQKDKLEFIEKNKDAFEDLGVAVNNVTDADAVFVKNTAIVVEALKLRAKAAAASALAEKKYQEQFVKEQELSAKQDSEPSFWEKVTGFVLAGSGRSMESRMNVSKSVQNLNIERLKDEAEAAGAAGDAYYKMSEDFKKAADEMLKSAGILPFTGDDGKKGRQRDAEDTLESLSLQARKSYEESVTALEEDEIKKRRKELIASYNIEVAELAKKYNKIQRIIDGYDDRYKKLTDEQKEQALKAQDDITKAIKNKQTELLDNLEDLSFAEQEHVLSTVLEGLNLQLDAVKQGSEDELKLRLKILDTERKIALARNAQLPASEQQSESAINASFAKQKTGIITDYNINSFDQQQALEESRFNVVKQTEDSITRFKLRQERDRWLMLIDLAKNGSLDWSKPQIEAAENAVKEIDRKLNDLDEIIGQIGKKGITGTILDSLGFDNDAISAFQQAVDTVISNLQEIAQAEVDLAQAAVDAAEERVEAAQSAYEAELEARNNGYANSVASARRELQQEKKRQQEKEKLLEQAQRRQEAINTLTQASSLITASANIWSSMSGIPIIGPALAIAAIASMWTSFAVAKVKARQVTASSSEEYGEGGLEFLEGGSHASGNDIDLGVKNKRKKRMRAEGGEALAIINKRSTRKYRRVLPDVIDSFNKGIFEEKYLNAFSQSDGMALSVNQIGVDLSRLEDGVDKIVKQGERQYVVKPDGTLIEIIGKTIRLIKQ